jgi:hypothetical protein
MQGICTYIPETNHVLKEYNVAAILSLLFMVTISLAPALALMCFYMSTFQGRFVISFVARSIKEQTLPSDATGLCIDNININALLRWPDCT